MFWPPAGRVCILMLSLAAAIPLDPAETLQQLSQAALENVKAELATNALKRSGSSCTLDKLMVRKDWNIMLPSERIAYTNAVLCFQSKPPRSPGSIVPGAKSRYDDFVGTHINQTLTIHYTGNFLAWHRWFTWNYEQALRNECGYTGAQPYWNWGAYSNSPQSGPVFDGSDDSMSGNGAYIPNKGPLKLVLPGLPDLFLPAGSGGGCVTSGPFQNMSVNLGPINLPLNNQTTIGTGPPQFNPHAFDYNPRCLKRDIGGLINQAYANYTSILNLLLVPQTIKDFQDLLNGVPGTNNPIGLHGAGHYTIAGDPGGDVFASPGDPAFYLHHGMIDRVWWIWQNLDITNRRNAIYGTNTFLNMPPSPNTTLDDPIALDYTNPAIVHMRDLMSTTDGPFCYVYL